MSALECSVQEGYSSRGALQGRALGRTESEATSFQQRPPCAASAAARAAAVASVARFSAAALSAMAREASSYSQLKIREIVLVVR